MSSLASLEQPLPINLNKVAKQFLVTYMLAGYRAGYLSCRIVDNKVVVDTFLFLTMDGTPKGESFVNDTVRCFRLRGRSSVLILEG